MAIKIGMHSTQTYMRCRSIPSSLGVTPSPELAEAAMLQYKSPKRKRRAALSSNLTLTITLDMSSIEHTSQFLSELPAFDVVNTHYKIVGDTAMPLSILIPKNILPGRHPVMVRWHGGCFITGHRLLPQWFGRWTLEEALAKQAILITPDYSLLPEASGLNILQDLHDFYSWLCTSDILSSHLPTGIAPDTDHLLILGESAGGWLAVQSGFLPRFKSRISAIIARYPMLDLRDGHYAGKYKNDPFDSTVAWDRSALATHLATLKGDEVVTSAIPPARMPLVVDAIRGGTLSNMLGDDSSLYVLEAVQKSTSFAPLWVIQGLEDRLVPIEGTQKFVAQLRSVVPGAQVHESYRSGPHGFDNDQSVSVEEQWIQDGLAFIEPFWPTFV